MRVTQAILPVAGLGTRFLPWTKVVPKELLPIGRSPIIALLVDECMSVGIRDICFVISRGKEMIPRYFTRHTDLESELQRRGKSHMLEELKKYEEVRFHVVYQEEMKGDGHAILQAAAWIETDEIVVLFGDDLIVGKKNGLEQLVGAYESLNEKEAAILCLQNVPKELVSKYGIVDVDQNFRAKDTRLHKVKGLVEKPSAQQAPSTLGIIGKYLIPRSTIDVLPRVTSGQGGEIRLIDALIAQLKRIPIYGVEMEGKRYDTGTPEGYREAVVALG